jgi:hypothetical protein
MPDTEEKRDHLLAGWVEESVEAEVEAIQARNEWSRSKAVRHVLVAGLAALRANSKQSVRT